LRPRTTGDRLAREIDDRVDARVARNLVETGDEPERRRQRHSLVRIARQHDRRMAGAGERRDEAAADEAGGAGHQHGLAGRERGHQLAGAAERQALHARRRREIAQAEQRDAAGRQGANALHGP